MALLKVLSCNLIFIVAAATFMDAKLYYTQQHPHYNIHFILYANQDIFRGEYNVSVYIPYDTQHIYFYTENLSIIKTILTNNTQISKENEEKVSAYRAEKFVYDLETYITTISFPYVLSSGRYILYTKFSGLLAEDGGFRTPYMNQQNNRVWLAATNYHTFATRRLFPLLKDSITYATYNISIKHHKNYTALSNMPVRAMNIDTNNMIWTHFQITPRMAENMIAVGLFVHLNLTSILEKNQRVRFWCRTGILQYMEFAYTTAKMTLYFLETRFSNIWKTPETNHIAIPKLLDEEDIKLGFVLYREADIIFDSESDYEIRQILEITQVVTYKVVYEWLYNTIDPAEWEPWLNKGLATFLGICAANEISPHLWISEHFVVQMQHDFLHWSTKNIWPHTIEEFNSSSEFPRYIKATIMFRTLQTVLTEKMFRNSIKIYLNQLYTSSDDFWDIMQSALDKSSSGMKYNLEYKISKWIQLNRYPVINVQRNYDKYSLNISVEDSNIDVWTLNIITQTNLKELLSVVWLTPHIPYHSQIIKDFMGKNDWILVNSSQSGCYRVNYDAENWSRLSEYLNFNTFEKIHVLDRAKIIDDAFHFVMSGQFNLNLFLNISRYLRHDTNYIAWYPMFKNLEHMSGFFAFPESIPIKTEIMQSLHEIFPEITYLDFKLNQIVWESAFTKYLREEAARWLCNIGHDDCSSKANNELEWYLLNRNKSSPYKIMKGWKEWTFCNGLMTASNDTWMEVFYMYSRESDYSILKFLACSKSASIILQYMHLIANMTNVTAIDRINSFCTIVARHARNNLVFDFILEKIKPQEISFITAFTMIINHLYSKQQINEIKKYMGINLKDNLEFAIKYEHHENGDTVWKSLPLTMNMIIMYVNHKIELRFRQIRTQRYQYRYLIEDYDYTFK